MTDSTMPNPKPQESTGGHSATVGLAIGLGVLLFTVMAVVGFVLASPSDDDARLDTALQVFDSVAITESSEEASRGIAEEANRTASVIAAVEAGAVQADEALGRAIEDSGGLGNPAAGGQTLIVGEPSRIPSPDSLGPQPVPIEVLEEDVMTGPFIDFDDLMVDVPDRRRIDVCAGGEPLADTVPGCPFGVGATILAVEDDLGVYRVGSFNDADCRATNDLFRLAVRANRPSDLTVSAWNFRSGDGSFDDPPPPGAVRVTGRTSDGDEARWYSELETGHASTIFHCFEFSDLERGRIGIHIRGVSRYLLDIGAVATAEDTWDWLSGSTERPSTERPPTGMTAIGTETLYVRAFRRSAVDEVILVQARLYPGTGSPSETCDTRGDIELAFEMSGARQGVLDQTIPLNTSGTGWPWSLEYDRLDVTRLHLEEGVRYVVCLYWVESGGPSFEPVRITIAEAFQVLTPDTSRLTVGLDSVVFADWIEDDPRINGVIVEAEIDTCVPAALTTNSSATKSRFLEPAFTMCQPTSQQGLIQRGGFAVTVEVVDSLGDVYRRGSWVRFDSNSIRCGAPCGERLELVAVPLPGVPSRDIRGYTDVFDTDTSSGRPAGDETPGQDGVPVGTATLELRFSPTETTGAQHWVLGDVSEYADAGPTRPVSPQLSVEVSYPRAGSYSGFYFSSEAPSQAIAVADVEITADRPVTLSATIASPSGGLCLVEAPETPTYSSSTPATVHVFELDHLCVGTRYDVIITAQDDTGTTAEIFGMGPADGSTAWQLDTKFVPIAITATLIFNDPGPVPDISTDEVWHYKHSGILGVDNEVPANLGGTGTYTVDAFAGPSETWEEPSTGWSVNLPYDGVLCDRSFDGPLLTSFPRVARATGVLINDSGIRFTTDVVLGTAQLPPRGGTAGGFVVFSCNRDVTSPRTTYLFTSLIELRGLIEGRDFVSDDGLVTLHIIGRPYEP